MRENNNHDELSMPPPRFDEILRFHSSKIIFNEEEADLIILKNYSDGLRHYTKKDFISLNMVDINMEDAGAPEVDKKHN